jgi:HD-GYP domain-containing protein (c-di-GMP phosphodiesterase class II)
VNLRDPIYTALEQYTKALSVALGFRDLYTRLHSERVVELACAVGARLGLSERDLGILKIGATFHDIGKIGIPDQILLKPGRLDAPETAAMQRHAALGAEILLAIELEGAAEVARVIRHHHERFDGQGYPDGLAGEDIPLMSRIVGIADSYDAMALARAYHPTRTHGQVLELLREETGRKHDPRLMGVFLEVLAESPFRAPEGQEQARS